MWLSLSRSGAAGAAHFPHDTGAAEEGEDHRGGAEAAGVSLAAGTSVVGRYWKALDCRFRSRAPL